MLSLSKSTYYYIPDFSDSIIQQQITGRVIPHALPNYAFS